MAFTDDVVKEAWRKSGGQCECRRRTHSHFYVPCGKSLVWERRGKLGQGGWEAHHISSWAGDVVTNCEILCWNCYESAS